MLGATIVYGTQAWIYRSSVLQMLATACGIISFWCFLYEFEWSRIGAHPQLWLLPPAIAALYFIERHRDQFSRSILTGARYFVILLGYLSSTADMMLMAFSESFWMPIVLLALSLVGVSCGMVFRIRALLFSSLAFILISLVGMVWHAQQAIDQVWPWWAFGIASGVVLIALLGYIEKNRERVSQYLMSLQAWDAPAS